MARICDAETDAVEATASQSVRSTIARATTATISVDGVLDETDWAQAEDVGDLVQRQPNPGQEPTEKTTIRLLYDADKLYIGVVAYDSAEDKVIGTQMTRDASLTADDRIEILLDTYHDRRNAFYFATNPSGAMVDGLVANEQLNTDWDAIWEVRTTRTDLGWIAEFAIPFKSLSFPAERTMWGFNLSRTIHRKLEEDHWSGARLETDFLQVSEAGLVTELRGISQGIGLDVRPFVTAQWTRLDAENRSELNGEPGVDIFYNITPSLKLTGTVNTDFAETDVDARQINLTRYSPFFPEKRSFFLEDIGVFTFASAGPVPAAGIPEAGADVYPFFSRRIGLLDGEEVPIDVGLKFAGKVTRIDFGALAVQTDNTAQVEQKNFFVGRVKYNFFRQSYIGAIATKGDPQPGQSDETQGLDLRLATSNFLGLSKNFVVNAYGLKSNDDNSSGKDGSYGISARFPNDKYDAQLVFSEIQENFDPGIGFVQRHDVRMMRIGASYNPRPKDFLNVQQMFHDVYYTRFVRLDNGQVESWDLYVTPLDWHFNSGDAVHAGFDFNVRYEQLFEPFEISPGVILPAGGYRFNRYKHNVASASKRWLSGSITYTWGDYWSGKAEQVTTMLTYKLPPRLTFTLRTDQTFAHLPEGSFTARIATAQINFSSSPFLSFSNLIQYDNRSENLGWQGRVRWTISPGNDLFFVVKQGWVRQESRNLDFAAQDSQISAKFQHTFRY